MSNEHNRQLLINVWTVYWYDEDRKSNETLPRIITLLKPEGWFWNINDEMFDPVQRGKMVKDAIAVQLGYRPYGVRFQVTDVDGTRIKDYDVAFVA